jgi:hypothetical protein
VCMDDIECHSFQEISTVAPIQVVGAERHVRLLVEEMMQFKAEVPTLPQNHRQDTNPFGLRDNDS